MIHIAAHRPPPEKRPYKARNKPPPPFVVRTRKPGEAPGVLIKPMQQPIYKPPAWVAPIR